MRKIDMFQSTKFQAPNPNEAPKHQYSTVTRELWSLVFEVSLELGAWDLVLFRRAAHCEIGLSIV